MIPQETVELILETAQIADVVGDFVTLKRRGANLVACCPFHNEKTPSFYVSPSKGIYKCFGCGKAGSAVGFVMEHEHYSYVEALRYLARKYHIEIVEEDETAEDIAKRQRGESLLLASEYASKFFIESLKTPEGQSIASQYFKSRGLTDESIEKYGLGWAPRSRDSFTKAAIAAGYKEEYLEETGLCARYDDGSLHDRFYDRVVFPIHSISGRVIAFGARTLRTDKEVAKYVNSKESEIYIKNKSLYGIYFAKSEIAKRDRCFLVEGYLDVLSMHQLGILNVVASSGTSLTEGQIRIIKKFTENITIMYDGDSAGIHAALRGINMILKEGMNVKIVLFPDGDDPDSYARKHTLEEFNAFIEASQMDFIDFKTDLLLKEAGNDPIRKANLINDIADTIAQIPDAVKRSVYVDTEAIKFGVESKILFERISAIRHKMLLNEKMEEERVQPYPQYEQEYYEAVQENLIVAEAEKEILHFLLKYGQEILHFESDSEYYMGPEDEPTVTDFIRDSLEDDQNALLNSNHQKLYSAYLREYDKNLSLDEIQKTLLDSADRDLAKLAADALVERHNLTIQKFKDSLTAKSSWLASFVPRTILCFMERKLESQLEELRKAMANADEQTLLGIMTQMVKLQNVQKKIQSKLGRDKKTF